MVDYLIGVFLGIAGGLSNFLGQVLMKKAINDLPPAQKDQRFIRTLIKNPTWLTGMVFLVAISGVFQLVAQGMIGGVLMPGLVASGLIILGIGSVKILGEKLTLVEIFAIILLFLAILLISLSQLSIVGTLSYFQDPAFLTRIISWTLLFAVAWLLLMLAGKRAHQYNAIYLALGSGMPFIISNMWIQGFVVALTGILGGQPTSFILIFFFINAGIQAVSNVLGLAHFQLALNAGNASIVIPIQQLPQQVAPVIIFFLIYLFPSPTAASLPFLLVGIALIMISGSILARRQAALERIK